MGVKKIFSNWFTTRYQLIVRNEEDLADKYTVGLNYTKLIILASTTFTVLFAFSLLLANTILAKWFNPAYMEQENSKKLIQLSAAVEALGGQSTQQDKFIKLIQSIVKGEEEPVYTLEEADSDIIQEEVPANPCQLEALAEADASLRKEFEEHESTLLAISYSAANDLQELFFFTPVKGIITTPFNPRTEHYGVDIVAKEDEPIKCIADGTVIFSSWTVETGWVIAVQHSKNLVSIYKHNASLLKKTGSFVKAGEVIAIIGNSGELSTGPHLHFEIWYEGNAVNPESFITF